VNILSDIEKIAPIFIVLFFSGTFGGLIGAIKKGGANKINLPFSDGYIKIGFFGDLIIGSAAAFVAYTFLSILPEKEINVTGPFLIRLFGFGVLTGYAGIAILDKISLDILSQKIDETKKELRAESTQFISESIEKASIISKLIEKGYYYLATDDFAVALDYYDDVLKLDPDNLDAKIGVAISRNYINPNDHVEPVKLLTDVLVSQPKDARALYNRACIKALNLGSYSSEDAINDLKLSILIKDSYAVKAKSDKDFDGIRDTEEFKNVLIVPQDLESQSLASTDAVAES
jgi:tetratricopeptide (TPR) repeat protein